MILEKSVKADYWLKDSLTFLGTMDIIFLLTDEKIDTTIYMVNMKTITSCLLGLLSLS